MPLLPRQGKVMLPNYVFSSMLLLMVIEVATTAGVGAVALLAWLGDIVPVGLSHK
jgi:hypothetical protein